MTANEVTDLPLPDSPTRPTCWPGRISNETSSTACTARCAADPEGDGEVRRGRLR